MFSVKHNECVGFESRWIVKKVYSVGSSQTSEIQQINMETSTKDTANVEIQTEPGTSDPRTASQQAVDEEKLAEWLKRIYPQVKKELDDVAASRAFKGYRQSTDLSDATCKLDQTVDLSEQIKDKEGRKVASMSWNSTNKTLAVSCTFDHKSWCYHEGNALIYSLDKDDKIPQVPKLKLATESCIVNVKFHPVLPAVLAGGLYSGAIVIWNVQLEKDEEQLVAKVSGHGESITQLQWVNDMDAVKNYMLVSSSLDGFITFWNFNATDFTMSAKERHQIKSPILPRNIDGNTKVKKVYRSVLCFDFSKHTPDMFIVGAEGGLVVQCSLLGATKISRGEAEVPILDSTFKYYEAHKGEINNVSFSPNRKDMFLTCASDSEIRIYLIGQDEPAQVIFIKSPLNCIRWIPYEEKLIAGCGNNGLVEIFQLVKGKMLENTTREKVAVKKQTEMQINTLKSNFVAVGTSDGLLQMWRIPWTLLANLE